MILYHWGSKITSRETLKPCFSNFLKNLNVTWLKLMKGIWVKHTLLTIGALSVNVNYEEIKYIVVCKSQIRSVMLISLHYVRGKILKILSVFLTTRHHFLFCLSRRKPHISKIYFL